VVPEVLWSVVGNNHPLYSKFFSIVVPEFVEGGWAIGVDTTLFEEVFLEEFLDFRRGWIKGVERDV